jgi:hypothetical protein
MLEKVEKMLKIRVIMRIMLNDEWFPNVPIRYFLSLGQEDTKHDIFF